MPAISPAVLNICQDDDEGSLHHRGERGRGSKVGGELIKDVKYADDQGMAIRKQDYRA